MTKATAVKAVKFFIGNPPIDAETGSRGQKIGVQPIAQPNLHGLVMGPFFN
jgi:hypothetical protein